MSAGIVTVVSLLLGIIFSKIDTKLYFKFIIYLLLLVVVLVTIIVSMLNKTTCFIWATKMKKETIILTLETNDKISMVDSFKLCSINKNVFKDKLEGDMDFTGIKK